MFDFETTVIGMRKNLKRIEVSVFFCAFVHPIILTLPGSDLAPSPSIERS